MSQTPREGQRGVSQQSNGRESDLHGSQVCIRHREPFLTPNQGKGELTYLAEELGLWWAAKLKRVLLSMKQATDQARARGQAGLS